MLEQHLRDTLKKIQPKPEQDRLASLKALKTDLIDRGLNPSEAWHMLHRAAMDNLKETINKLEELL